MQTIHKLAAEQPVTQQELADGIQAILLIGRAIRAAKHIPSGHLYAMVMPKLPLESYNKIIQILKGSGTVIERHGELFWSEPTNN